MLAQEKNRDMPSHRKSSSCCAFPVKQSTTAHARKRLWEPTSSAHCLNIYFVITAAHTHTSEVHTKIQRSRAVRHVWCSSRASHQAQQSCLILSTLKCALGPDSEALRTRDDYLLTNRAVSSFSNSATGCLTLPRPVVVILRWVFLSGIPRAAQPQSDNSKANRQHARRRWFRFPSPSGPLTAPFAAMC